MASLFGLLNINKTAGMTSRDVVNHVQRLIRPTKVGHAGTLDPLATGVLVLGVGRATRLFQYIQRMPKRYRATFELGKTSETDDVEGTVADVPDAVPPAESDVQAALTRFVGEIEQRPPAYSALKVAGKRAYERARRGEEVRLEPRPVVIHSTNLIAYDYPTLVIDVECGSGTYIRSLGRDVGELLGCGAVMSALDRTAIGSFTTQQAISLEQITKESVAGLLIPATRAIDTLPRVTLTEDEVRRVVHGQAIAVESKLATRDGEIAAVNCSGELVAILKGDDGRLRPVQTFVEQRQHA